MRAQFLSENMCRIEISEKFLVRTANFLPLNLQFACAYDACAFLCAYYASTKRAGIASQGRVQDAHRHTLREKNRTLNFGKMQFAIVRIKN